MVPALRINPVNTVPVRADGRFVLYWMISARRPGWNFALDRAVEHAVALNKPLVIVEVLRCDYPWASDRLHAFVIDGMAHQREAFARASSPVLYWPYVEPARGAGKGLLEALAAEAALVVTDEFPCFFLPRMVAAAGARLSVRLEQVDSNGLLPLRAAGRPFERAVDFRRFLQGELARHLGDDAMPSPDPLRGANLAALDEPPAAISSGRWPAADLLVPLLASLPIDHSVAPVEGCRGGAGAGAARLRAFVSRQLDGYGERRNEPASEATSGLSPYLHFGHVSAHQVLDAVARHEGEWNPSRLGEGMARRGAKAGWWGMSASAEGFLDQVVTWRELGYNVCFERPHEYDRWSSLPPWARATLDKHASDPRRFVYDLGEFEAAATHDPLWNAAQRELLRTGRIHNYLRMLWGKKILEWSPTPPDALAVMIELNNKYALDGRNPNSMTGIFWCLGRHDRPWPPERPVFGQVRYMSSENTARKFHLATYLDRFGPETESRSQDTLFGD